ncbi:MAG: hypothetical protein AAGF92_16175 [Myxococcota bacterium]
MTTKPKTDPPSEDAREPYEAPRIVYREPLEAVATACTAPTSKANAGACPVGPVSS